MPRFVILRHDMPAGASRPTHWDLLLERDGVLRAWALADEPSPGVETSALALADHRLIYLDYEGPISGERGSVVRFDRGEYQTIEERDDLLVVELAGDKLAGRVRLMKDPNDADGDQRWIARFVITD
jgi:hypothetical protein